MKCEKCGFENLDSAHVCRKCGATLDIQNSIKNSGKSDKKTIAVVIALILVILLVVIALFASGVFNQQPTETQVPVVANQTEINHTAEVVYVANGTGSGSNTFQLDAGNYIFNISVTPLNKSSYFNISNLDNQLFNLTWETNNLTTNNSSVNFTNNVSSNFTIEFFNVKSWNLEVIKIK